MKNLLILTIMIVCCSNSCDKPPVDHVYRIWLKDNSGEGFAFLVSYNYPDTIIPNEYNKLIGVPPNKRVPYDSKEKWEEVFEDLQTDTLSIFIFDGDTLANYDWENIRANYKVLKRYDISLENINDIGTIAYPPTEEMKEIKMWP